MLLSLYRIYVYCAVLLFLYNIDVESFKIRYGREKCRIDKLRRRKGAILDKLNSYIRARGYGLLPLKALPEDSIDNSDLDQDIPDYPNITALAPDEEPIVEQLRKRKFELFKHTCLAKKKKKTKNPLIPRDFDQFNPLFKKIASLRTYKSDIDYNDRPGRIDPKYYRPDFVEEDGWDIHPSNIRVRGVGVYVPNKFQKYFSKLYEYELKEPMKRHENDTGSPEVVISAITAKIDYLSYHVEHNKKVGNHTLYQILGRTSKEKVNKIGISTEKVGKTKIQNSDY